MHRLKLLVICGVTLLCQSHENVTEFEDEEAVPYLMNDDAIIKDYRTVTIFWNRNREKVARFINNLTEPLRFNEKSSRSLHLPNASLNTFRGIKNMQDPRNRPRSKVLEVTETNFTEIPAEEISGRLNITCEQMEERNCSVIVRVAYITFCRHGRSYRRCIGFRNQQKESVCQRYIKVCCDGYEVGESGYCERIRLAADSGCGSPRVLREQNGIISTRNYPRRYANNIDCSWLLETPANHLLIITFIDLDIEDPIGICDLNRGTCHEDCQFDILTLRNVASDSTKTLCGYVLPQVEYIYRNTQVEITFTSDVDNQGRGFKLAYSIVPENSFTPKTCPGGQVWKLCRRVCLLTCEDTISSAQHGPWNICVKSEGSHSIIQPSARDDMTCQPGCTCPQERPVWHRGKCVKVEKCPQHMFRCGFPFASKKIVGGAVALDGAWPWMVQISTDDLAGDCAGVLICSDWVLTVAHCFLNQDNWRMPETIDLDVYWFQVGKYWKRKQIDRRRVEVFRASRIIIHQGYNYNTDVNDIALVRLNGYVRQWTRIRPICLPPPMPRNITSERQWESFDGFPGVGDSCMSAGWGNTRGYGPSSFQLKVVRIPITPVRRCNYSDFIWRKTICAGGVINQDTCQGDSGGGFMCKRRGRWFVDGITSFGNGCGEGTPGGYTRVSNYVTWIRQRIGFECAL